MPNHVLIIQNDPTENLGLYEEFLHEKAEVTLLKAYDMKLGEQFPPTKLFHAFIVGPTPISANDTQNHVFLRNELGYLQTIIESGKPVLGVCCGGQMLAKLQGAEVLRSPSKEIGCYTVALTNHGKRDPLFRGFPNEFPVFQWHQDMFTVPPNGRLLATGTPCPIQAYAKGNVRGLIFHLEINSRAAENWIDAYPNELIGTGRSREEVIRECRKRELEMRQLAERLVENLLVLPAPQPFHR